MRLLFVHESFGSFGGAEANVFATASGLRKRGHEVGLAARFRTAKGEPEWKELFGKNAFFPTSAQDWKEIMGNFRPDLIYIHKWEENASMESLIESRLPIVRMVHDHDLYCLRSYKYNPLSREICHRPASAYCIFPCLATFKRERDGLLPIRWVSYFEKIREIALNRRLDRLVVASEYMKNELAINRFDPGRVEILPPVPPPGISETSNFASRNLLLYVGQLVRGKGVDVLLEAMKKVREPFELVIAGDGTHREYCETLSKKLGLESRVRFLGFVTQKELISFYQEATAVVVSSVWPEPFGLVGIEVMRQGLPVVAFDAGGISDWLTDGENGFLVPWMDTDAYADRIGQLLRDKSLAKTMGERGRERAASVYDFENYLSNVEKLLERVKSGKN